MCLWGFMDSRLKSNSNNRDVVWLCEVTNKWIPKQEIYQTTGTDVIYNDCLVYEHLSHLAERWLVFIVHVFYERGQTEKLNRVQHLLCCQLCGVSALLNSLSCFLQTAAQLTMTPQWPVFRDGYGRPVLNWYWFLIGQSQNTDELLQQSVLLLHQYLNVIHSLV